MKREVIATPGAPAPMAHYCQGVLAGDTLYAAGQIASDYKTGVAPEARQDPAFPYYGSDIKRRTHYVMKNLAKTFKAAGSSLDHIVKAQVFLQALYLFDALDDVWKQYFKTPPARTTVGTTGLLVKDAMIEIDETTGKATSIQRVAETYIPS